jgi:hypothetical protein
MDQEINDVRVNNSIYQTTSSLARLVRKRRVIDYWNSSRNNTKLDRKNHYNSIKEVKENDFDIIFCLDRVCKECEQDHSFTNNFEGVKTSIDALHELFPQYFPKREAFSN